MKPIAANQSLDLFMKPNVATCSMATTGLEALSLLENGLPYIAVVNQYHHPQGLFNSECVLGWLHAPDHAHKPLAELNLQPLPAIAATTTVSDFLDRLCQYQHSAEIWALVDHRNKYVGVIEVLPLMRQMAWQKWQGVNPQSLEQLISLAHQLPLPVTIYDSNDQILGINQLWQSKFGQMAIMEGDRCLKLQDHTWQITIAVLAGEFQGIKMAIAQDVTTQEHLTQELSSQNANLVRMNRIKDEFLACISHELKTPLTSVIGMASLLSTENIGSLNDRQKRYVNMIHHNGRHLTFMIDNVMDLAKAEAGQLELHPETLAIAEICEQTIQQTHKLLQKDSYNTKAQPSTNADLEIQLNIAPEIATLIADRVRVQQMLVNLLSNAVKFNDKLLTQIQLSVQMWEGWITFTVSDRGIGIPQHKQHLIFQKFQQLENTLTRQFDGAGLGLVLTRHLARLHGGDVTFRSKEGEGSEFTVLLPPAPPHLLSQVAVSCRLVLIVENEEVDHLTNLITTAGYRVVVARSGTEALEKARKLQPCLILLSPDLPMLSGWDVLSLLKQDLNTQSIRVAMMINPQEYYRDEYADGYLAKPIQQSELQSLLDRFSGLSPLSEKLMILIVGEQHPQITGMLQGLDYRVITASDVGQGEVLACIWHPSLVLLDCDPIALTKELRRLGRCQTLQDLPILVIDPPSPIELPALNIYSLNNLENLDLIMKKALGDLQAPTILLFNFFDAQPLKQYLISAGFQILDQTLDQNSLLASLRSPTIDILLIRLNDQDQDLILQKQLVTQATIPVIVIDGRTDRPNLVSLDPIIMEKSVTIIDQNDAIALLIPTLRKCLNP